MDGTLLIYDRLDARFQYANTKISTFGEAKLAEIVKEVFDRQNGMMRGLVTDLCGYTTERDMMYGTGDTTSMIEVDEVGTAPPTKTGYGSVVGFPLRRYEKAWQGSKKWLKRATVGEMMMQVKGVMTADKSNTIRAIKTALFSPTNYSWTDKLVDRRNTPPLAVKALVNADGMPIPYGPNNEVYNAGTHAHYLATASLSAADMVALKTTVLEHYGAGAFVFAIPTGLESAIRAMTSNFVPALPKAQVGATTATQLPGETLAITPIANRLIGEFDGVPVIVKPWMPASYVAFYIVAGAQKVLMIRTEAGIDNSGDLQIDAEDEDHPLVAETYSREFGVGVLERTGAAVLYTGGASYVTPIFV